jgi:anti-sigma B factor antagonist
MAEERPYTDLSGYAHDERTYVVQVTGELDLHLEPQLREELNQALGDGFVHVVVDLTDVNFLDSSALGRLVEAAKRLATRGGSIVLAAPDRQIRRLLEITALDRIFAIAPSLDDAIGGLRTR